MCRTSCARPRILAAAQQSNVEAFVESLDLEQEQERQAIGTVEAERQLQREIDRLYENAFGQVELIQGNDGDVADAKQVVTIRSEEDFVKVRGWVWFYGILFREERRSKSSSVYTPPSPSPSPVDRSSLVFNGAVRQDARRVQARRLHPQRKGSGVDGAAKQSRQHSEDSSKGEGAEERDAGRRGGRRDSRRG